MQPNVNNNMTNSAPQITPMNPGGDVVFRDKPKKNKGMIIGMVILALLAAGGIGFGVWAFLSGNQKEASLNSKIDELNSQVNAKDEEITGLNEKIEELNATIEESITVEVTDAGTKCNVGDTKCTNAEVESGDTTTDTTTSTEVIDATTE